MNWAHEVLVRRWVAVLQVSEDPSWLWIVLRTHFERPLPHGWAFTYYVLAKRELGI